MSPACLFGEMGAAVHHSCPSTATSWPFSETLSCHKRMYCKILASSKTCLVAHTNHLHTLPPLPPLRNNPQLVTTRQLSKTLQGEYSWVIGPETAAGMSLGITRRMEKLLLTGRVEVGAVTGFVGRVARRVGEKTTARAGVRLGPASAEVDVGGQRTLSELATGGLSIVTGPQVRTCTGVGPSPRCEGPMLWMCGGDRFPANRGCWMKKAGSLRHYSRSLDSCGARACHACGPRAGHGCSRDGSRHTTCLGPPSTCVSALFPSHPTFLQTPPAGHRAEAAVQPCGAHV